MFCGNCGKQIEDTINVCPYCGVMVENEVVVGNDSKYSKIFVEPDENYIGSLGNGYLNSFLTDKGINRCVAILSDKRIYLRGNMIDLNSGKIERFNMQKTIDLEDITGTGFVFCKSASMEIDTCNFDCSSYYSCNYIDCFVHKE